MAEKKGSFISRVASFIVDKRNVFFLLYGFAFLFCIFAMGWVNVENDMTKYLPEDAEIRQGYDAMSAHFTITGMGKVMVSNITYETAEQIYEEMSKIEGITMVTFDNTEDHYRDASALYDVNFDGGNFDASSHQALDAIHQLLEPYDHYVDTEVGYDVNAMLDDEMLGILVVAVVLIITVLILTSRAYMEVPVLLKLQP